MIEELIEQGKSTKEILGDIDTSEGYIWKVKSYLKKGYIKVNGKDRLPSFLHDKRRSKK